jgi:hypothetical protein
MGWGLTLGSLTAATSMASGGQKAKLSVGRARLRYGGGRLLAGCPILLLEI